MTELLLQTRGLTPALALTRDRLLVDYRELREDLALMAGAIYLGRAGRVMKGLEAVFVSLGGGVEGFLPFSEMPEGIQLKPGDTALVQIKKPAQGGKAAYLTCDVALPGRFSLLLPQGGRAGASGRARNPKALRQLASELCPKGMGLVLRAQAQGADREDILKEISGQAETYRGLLEKAAQSTSPRLLLPAPDAVTRLLRDEQVLPERVITDEEKAARGLGFKVHVTENPFSLYGVEKQLHQALKRRVYLPSGGFLVLDPCEAALMIDVNSGQDTCKAGDLALKVNLEAAREIARLLRLRRAGGIILIDFIDMPGSEQRQQVQAALEEALREDPVKSEVLGFTRLGLMEMTRKKAQAPLLAQGPQAGDRETDDILEEPHA